MYPHKDATFLFLIQLSMWYLFSVLFNIEIKSFFIHFNIPFIITFFNLLVSFVGSASILGRDLILEPEGNQNNQNNEKISNRLYLVGILHFLGTLSTNLSISEMTVSFTHVIKVFYLFFFLFYSLFFYFFISSFSPCLFPAFTLPSRYSHYSHSFVFLSPSSSFFFNS